MLLVTGGAGFIGSNVVAALNDAGRADVAVCDLLGHDGKWRNLAKHQVADIVPPAIQLLSEAERAGLTIVQQARTEDDERVRGIYEKLGIRATVSPFFKDLPAQMAAAHLIIARSGASTVAELTVIGRPAILVPLPGSLDQDQAANAAFLEGVGGAIRILQPEFTPRHLAAELSKLIAQPAHLTSMAANAKSAGIPDAADRLADLVIATANFQN